MKATVSKVIQETCNVKTWIFELEEPMFYKTAQFVTLKVGGVSRPFSIACPPGNPKEIRITARIYQGGSITPAMDRLKIGDEVEIAGPYGKFIYEPARATLIGAGTGIVPLRGILHCALLDGQEAELYYSDRTERDMIYKKELEQLAKDGKIKLKFFVTREQGNEKHITKRIDYDFLRENLKKDGLFYVCGPPKFVDDTIENLKKLGIGAGQIRMERFN